MTYYGWEAFWMLVLLIGGGFVLVAIPCIGLAKWCRKNGFPVDFI